MKRLIVLILSLSNFFICFSQIDILDNKNLELSLKVKQLSQFISRFNYIEDFDGNKPNRKFIKKFPRKSYLYYLFDLESARSSNNLVEINKIREFVNDVCNDSLPKFINIKSNKVFSIIKADVTYNGIKKDVEIYLHKSTNGQGISSWVIYDVEADFLNISQDIYKEYSLPPTSDEIAFMALKKAFEKKEYLFSILNNNYEYNTLSVFLFLVFNDEIIFNYVTDIQFILLDIDNWALEIDEFNRESLNSGWLVSNLIKLSDSVGYIRNKLKLDPFPLKINTISLKESSLKQYCPTLNIHDTLDSIGLAGSTTYYGATILQAKKNNTTNIDSINSISLSPYYTTKLIRDPNNLPPNGKTNINNVLYLLKNIGMIPNSIWDRGDSIEGQSIENIAAKNRILDYFLLFHNETSYDIKINNVKTAITNGFPVIIAFNAPPSFVNTDSIWNPKKNENPLTYYEPKVLTVIGFKETKDGNYIEVINSTASDWGNNGFGYISYDTFVKFSLIGYEMRN